MNKIDKFRLGISVSIIIMSVFNIVILYNTHNELQNIKSSISSKHRIIEIKKCYSESDTLPDVAFSQVDSSLFNH